MARRDARAGNDGDHGARVLRQEKRSPHAADCIHRHRVRDCGSDADDCDDAKEAVRLCAGVDVYDLRPFRLGPTVPAVDSRRVPPRAVPCGQRVGAVGGMAHLLGSPVATMQETWTSRRLPYGLSTMNVSTAVVMVLLHIGAVAALFTFTWTNVFVALFLYWVAGGLGICLGYHRLHTHRGYRTSRAFEYFLAVCGTLALEGGPIFWVAVHRAHHQHSDRDGDPHTPRDGGFWAHMGWILFGDAWHNDTAMMARYAPDLAADPFYRWLNTWHFVPNVLLGLALLAVGGWPLVLWGLALRVVVGLHATWLVNSATHMWGSRRFDTRDDSRNNWWVA